MQLKKVKTFTRGLGNIAISNAAMGSSIGAFIALIMVYNFIAVEMITKFYNNDIQSVILLLASLSKILLGHSILQILFYLRYGFLISLLE